MLAKPTCIAETARRSIVAFALFAATLVASPAAWSQTAVNTASIAPPATVTDPNNANNSATDSDAVVRNANLALAKTATPNPVILGQTLSYTLTVTNGGPSAILASDTFSIQESLPAGLTGCTYTPSGGTFNVGSIAPGATGTGTWTGLALANGGSATLTIVCTVGNATAASITNTATVLPPTGVSDPDCSGSPVACAGNNTSTAGTTVNRPELTLTKTASAASFTVGVPASYTLQVSNTGTAATTAVSTITDTIPTGLTIGTLPAGCTSAGQTVTCTIPSGLAAGGSTSFVIPVTPTVAAQPSVTNTATVSGGGDPTCPAAAHCTSTAGPTPVNAPELTLTKTASAASFTVGVPASYTLQVQNTGTAATTVVSTITDTIPTGLTIGTLPAGCTSAGQTVTCTIAAGLAAGGSTSFVIPVTPTAAAQPSVTNTATVSGGGDPTCPAAAHCTSTAGPTPVNAPVLTLTKTASAASFTVGVPASYTLAVQNTGTAATTAVSTITDTIPTGLTIGTLPAGCTSAGQTVTCTIPSGLAAGGSTSFVIPVTPTAAAQPSVTNTATVSGGGDPTCPAAAHCTSTAGPTPVNAPELTLTKTASAASFTVGVPASYTLQVSNTGTAATTAVSTITDTIPTGLTIGTLPAGCTSAGQTVTCTIAAGLAAGANTSFVIPVTPTASAAASVTNTATVSGGGDPTCPAAAHCTSTAGPTPVNAPVLTLTKTASAASFTVGVPASYTLAVQNTGTAATTAVSTITDTIPTGLTIGTLPAGCTAAGQTVTCTIPSGLAAGGSTSFVIPVTPTAAAQPSVTNTASVSGGGDPTCPAAAHCTSTAGPTPVNAPELTLTKTASAASFTVGVPASYTLQVSNTGTAATTAVSTITDTIPTGLTIGTLPAGCTAAGQTVTCTIPSGLAAGSSTSFVIPVTPTAAAQPSVTNTATVSGGGDPTCPAAAHCTSTAGPTPVNAPVLTLTKTASAASFTVGVPASYTLQVSNTGTAATTAVSTITDTIPTGLTIGTLPAGCTSAGQTVTCTIAAGLAAGGSTSFVIPVTPTAAAQPSVTNTATVSGGGDPTCPAAAHCTSTAGPTPVNAPVLTLTKTASAASFTVGVPASYTLQVSNTGTAATTAVSTITDTIPTGLTIGTLPAGCTSAGQTVTCTIAAGLAAGANTSFVIPVTPTASAAASVTNTATVSGGGDPTCPAAAHCTSSVTTAVDRVDINVAKTTGAVTGPSPTGIYTVDYVVTVTNSGSAAGTYGPLFDGAVFSANLNVLGATWTTSGTGAPPGGANPGVSSFPIAPANTAIGAGVTHTFNVTFTFSYADNNPASTCSPTPNPGDGLYNEAALPGGQENGSTADNATCVNVPPPPPLLTLTKTASAASFTVGVPASYTLQVSNTGGVATTAAATITDTIPTGLTIGTLPAGCTAAGQTVTCTIAAGLAAGGSTSFVIPVTPTVAAQPSVTNTATVSGGGDPTCPAAAHCTSTAGPTPVNAPVLTLTKTASAASFTVGVPASYTLSVQNTGTAATTAVSTITDTIPTGLTIGTLPAGCTSAGQTVTCTIAAGLAAGANTSFVIPVTPTAAAAPSVTNTATVSGGGDPTCPAAAHCTSTAGPTPVNAPVLTLTKTASAASFTVGVPASYTLSVQNTGTAATTATATITDTIPTGLTIGTLPAGCTAAGQTVTCTIAAGLAAGGSTSFVIPVTPTAAAQPSVTNTATVSGGGDPTCPAAAHCTSTAGPTPVNAPVLTLTKTASAASFTVGVPASYTLQVSNTGTAATTAVSTITDTIPTGLTIGTLPAGCTAAGQTVTCTIPSGLAAGGSTSFVIPVTPTAAAQPSVTNTATVSGGGDPTCPAAAHCTSTAGPTPVGGAELTLQKTASASPWTVGVAASYTLQVTNTGTAATTAAATITDTIPASLTIGTLPAGCTAAGQTVTCTIPSGLAASASTSFVIPVTPTAAAAPSVTNTATVSGGGDPTCPAAAHCTSTAGPTPVDPSADVAIVKSQATPNPAVPGQTVTWTITVTNNGPSDAAGVQTADTVPVAVTGLAVGGADSASCTVAGQNVTCNFGTVANGATRTYTITGTLAANFTGNLANTATVTSTTSDPTPGNNSSTSSTPSATTADAAISKTLLTASPVAAGGTVTYQLVVTNAGPSDLAGASVSDTVPAQLTGVTWNCAATGSAACGTASGSGNVALNVDIAAGAGNAVTITVTGTAPVTTPNTIGANTATVTVPVGTTDPNPGNNTSTVPPITVTALAIDAVDDTGTVASGAAGGTAVPNVLANDTLNGVPATLATVTLTQVTTTNPNVTLNPATGAVTVAPGTPAGTYTLVYRICEQLNPTNCDTATVTVTVGAATIDAVDDSYGPVNGAVGATTPSVLANDTLGGSPATVGVGGNVTLTPGAAPTPAAGSITMNADGTITIAPGTTAGVYTYPYTICEVLNPTNCDTATATVTVNAAAIDAVDDTGTVASGAAGGTAVPNVLANDTLNGVPATLATVTLTQVSTTNPNVTLNPATGAVSVAPGTPAGTYTLVYQICEQLNPTNCDTATVTVTVGAATIDAVDDSYGPVNGAVGATTPSVLVNDTLGGAAATVGVGGNVTLTPGAAPTPASGSLTMNADGTITIAPGTTAGVYTYPYTICEVLNPTNCDTATATVTVNAAAIDAVDDTGTVASGAAGGTAVPNVLANDTLNGVPATLATVTLTQVTTTNPNVTLNPATGAVTVAPGTPAGTYTLVYRICEQLNPTNCDTATVTVTVGAATIDAVDDSYGPVNGAVGATTPSVLANDTLGGSPATVGVGGNVTLTPGAAPTPAAGSITMNADGTITIAPGTTAGVYTYPYTICEVLNPTNCDTATATVTVNAAAIDAVDDTGTVASGAAGGTAVPNVLANDTLNGVPATLATVTLTQVSTTNPNVTLNPATGAVSVAPGTPAGTYTLVYQICEQLNPTNCDTATVTVTVGAATIDAVDDSYGPVNGAVGATTPSVLVNDTLGGAAATVGVGGNVTLTPGAAPTPASGSLTMNADGTITIAPGTTAGVYTYPYTICEVLNPTNCDTATATVTVNAAAIDAVDDTGTVASGAAGGTAVPNVLANDTLNGVPATLATVTLTQVTTTNPNVTLNPATGAVTVAPGTPAGTYTLVYRICEQLNPTNCDTATVTVTVGAATIDAVDDSYGPVNGAVGATTPSVLANDTLGGSPATVGVGGNVTLTPGAAPTPAAGSITMNADGTITIAPGTTAGVYTYPYTICEVLNPTNCDTATATVTVNAAAIDAVDDTGTVASGAAGGTAVPNVLANDTLNGVPATLATVTLTQVSTTNPNVTLNPATGAVSVAPGTPAGTYTLVYQICEQLNPTNCDTATVTVTVGAATIDAVDDSYGPVNGAVGATTPSVLVNDTLGGAAATVGVGGNVTLTPGAAPTPASGSLTMNADGTITIAPGTTAGVYTYPYTICEVLNPTNCDTATATVTVNAAAIDAVDDTGTVASGAAGGTAVPNVLANDTLNGVPATLATVTLTQVTTTNPNVTLNPATGAVTVAPGTPAGTYTLVYRICEQLNPTNCDTATVTVTVGAATIDAVDDSYGPVNGAVGATTPSVLANDTLGGSPATVGVGGNVTLTPGAAPTPAAGSITMNADGTITIAPGTTAGVYTYPYTICEVLNPTNCDTATATVTVNAAAIDAVDDTGTVASGAAGGTAVPNVLANDTLNGVPATLATVTLTQVSTTNPNVTLNPATGAVSVAPGTPAGTYTLVYQICEQLNPTNCDTATVTVTVGAATIDAVDDSYGPVNGAVGATTPSVLVNDTLGGAAATVGVGGNVTLTPGAAPTPASGSLTMNADGTITIAPGTTAGVYTYPYTICEVLNPTNCDTATATVTVNAAAIDAVDDTGTVASGAAGGTAVPNVLANDTLNGVPATLATVTLTQVSTTNPNVTLNPATGAVNVAPGTPAGTYTLVYRICEQLNPTNCDTATVTVTVGAAVIDAVDDTGTVASGAAGGTAVPNVLVNDTLNGVPATLATVTISQVSTSNPNVTIDPATGAVNVAPGTPAGTYTLVYRICEQLNPTNCDTATVTVTVGAAVIDALDDTGTVANGAAGGTAVPNVLVNDTLNGVPATLATVTISQVSTSNPNVTIDPATGAVNVAPGTPAGTYTLVYRICEILNPTNCDTATVTVTVGAAVIDAVDDSFPPVSGVGGGTTASVLGNDTLNGVAVTPADITLTPGVAPMPASGSITMNPDGTITIAAGTEAGTYTYPYTICEALNPANCDSAVATVVVAAAPGLTIDKIAGTPTASAAGATIPYSFVVTNTGNVTVTGLTINDAQLDAAAVCPATTLAPGASTTCTGTHTITQAEVDAGTVDNTATATGTLPGNGGNTVSPPDSTSTPIAQNPAISATKTATLTTDNGVPGMADEGDVITYAVSVTNTGNVTLNNLAVSDSFEGATPTTLSCTPTTLAPGATATCASYTHTVTAAEALAGGTLDNVATATALSSTSAQTVTSTSTAVVAVNGAPATIRVTKTASPRDVHVGDLVRYTVTMENTSQTAMTDGMLIDTPPAGFVYVDGSLQVADADNAGRLVGTNPIRVDQIDIAGGDRATVTYLLRVGAGVRAGVHTNSALVEDNGDVVSNTATADVQLVADPLLDDSLILGTVFNDRDGDGWQDAAGLGDVHVQGGFAPEAYVPNSTTVDRGAGPKPEADASSPMLHGIAIGDIAARQSEGDAVANHTVVVRQKLRELRFTDDFVLTSAQGVTVRMAADGSTRVEKRGDAAKGLNAAEPTVERRVSQVVDGYVVDYVIANAGIDERGIPGVRLATVEGLLVETDQYGRYHLAGVDGGRWERGRNLILKVDAATLPPGTVFTTDNPLVKRVTPGVPTRFDFGVKLPVSVLEGATQAVEMELGSVMFAPDSAEIRPQYRPAIDKIAETAQGHAGGEIVIGAEGDSDLLAFERAIAVRDALVAKLPPETAAGLRISVRANPHDPDSTVVGVMEWPLIGTFLFETDRAEIKPEYRPLVRRIADYLVAIGTTRVAVVGHADKRGAEDYNVALGMRRAKAVYEAIAEALPANVRGGLRVDINEDPAAPAGMNGQ